jgi:hypothetical protein
VDFNQLKARLGRNGIVIAAGGLLAIIVSLFPWFGITGSAADELKKLGYKTSSTAWGSGFGAWFPMLLLFLLGVMVVLAALDVIKQPPLMLAFIEAAAALLATVVVLLRWVTYPSASGVGGGYGALWGTYVGVVIAVAVTVFGYLDFAGKGGDIKNLGAAFQQKQVGPPPQG